MRTKMASTGVSSRLSAGTQAPAWASNAARHTCLSMVLLPAQKKKGHDMFSSQLRADQMPGLPREGQLMCTLFLSMRQQTEQHQ